jgi:hypothetical protein
VHVTESGEKAQPQLSTHVETTAGPMAEAAVTNPIHAQWHATQLLPRLHSVATGYLEAELLVSSQRDDGVEWLGPTSPDDTWQAQAGQGVEASHFVIDGAQPRATCPMGQSSSSWTPVIAGRHNAGIKSKVAPRACPAGASRLECTRAKRRTMTVRPHEQ